MVRFAGCALPSCFGAAKIQLDEPLRGRSRVELFAAALSAELRAARPGEKQDKVLLVLEEEAGGLDGLGMLRRRAAPDLFPRLVAAAQRQPPPLTPDGRPRESSFRAYLTLLASLNALLVTAHQITADADAPETHLYMGHQLALLHHCMKTVRTELRPLRALVEEQFNAFKDAADRAKISDSQKAWVKEVSKQVVAAISRWPPSLAAEVQHVVKALRVAINAVPDD